jgi:hypothetical protein
VLGAKLNAKAQSRKDAKKAFQHVSFPNFALSGFGPALIFLPRPVSANACA